MELIGIYCSTKIELLIDYKFAGTLNLLYQHFCNETADLNVNISRLILSFAQCKASICKWQQENIIESNEASKNVLEQVLLYLSYMSISLFRTAAPAICESRRQSFNLKSSVGFFGPFYTRSY